VPGTLIFIAAGLSEEQAVVPSFFRPSDYAFFFPSRSLQLKDYHG